MDAEHLHLVIENVSTCGAILSTEEKSCLQTSLVTLKAKQKFSRVIFWGKIIGVQSSYYVVQGLGQDEMTERNSLYSMNGLDWAILPTVTAEILEKAMKVRGRFTGDPSYEMEYKIERRDLPTGDDENGEAEGKVTVEEVSLKEEDRLAAVVSMIDEDTLVVPRGAYVRRASGAIATNRTWEGLKQAEAILPKNYYHFRSPHAASVRTEILRRPVPGLDFLESIEKDIPNGCWTCHMHRGTTVVMRSLLWLGYFFYHIPGTRQFGSVYFGYGEKNLNLPFML